MLTIVSQLIFAGFMSAALLWSVGLLWQVLRNAANMAAIDV